MGLLLGLAACTSLLQQGSRWACQNFYVTVANSSDENKFFYDKVVNSLKNKLSLVTDKGTGEGRTCQLQLDFTGIDFLTVAKDTIKEGLFNGRLDVIYRLQTKFGEVLGHLSKFYRLSITPYKYADHFGQEKEIEQLVESVAEDIFLDMLARSH
jgi:hypothetical protein